MDIVLTSFFTNEPDAQRGVKWDADEQLIYPLAASCEKRGIALIVLNDCFEDGQRNGAEFVKVAPTLNPYFERWLSQGQWLVNNTHVGRVFMVDATDVIMQFDPFHSIEKGKIYIGDEFSTVGTEWVRENGKYNPVDEWIKENPDLLLLNCGVVGGERQDLINVCNDIITTYRIGDMAAKVEMPIFNYVMRQFYNDRIVHGRGVTTIFKEYQANSGAWFKHK